MKDRGRNTRRHPVAPPWNTCPSCRALVALDYPLLEGWAFDCLCGLELEAVVDADGSWRLILVTVDLAQVEDEARECDFCGEDRPCLCDTLDEEAQDENERDCMDCGFCDDCIEATKVHMADAEHFEHERQEVAAEEAEKKDQAERDACFCNLGAEDFPSGKSVCGIPCPVHAPRKAAL